MTLKQRREKAHKQKDERILRKALGLCQRCAKDDDRTRDGYSVCAVCSNKICERAAARIAENRKKNAVKPGRPSKYLTR